MLYTATMRNAGSGLGWIWEPGNSWADYFCLLPGTSGLESCAPVPSISAIRNQGLDCTQSGWRGKEALCAELNAADDATFLRILEREKSANPDLYRDWYNASGGKASNPDVPEPEFSIPSWAWAAGIGLVVFALVAKR